MEIYALGLVQCIGHISRESLGKRGLGGGSDQKGEPLTVNDL